MRTPRHLYREPGDAVQGRLHAPRLIRVVTLAKLLGEAVLIFAAFAALGFALVVLAALLNPTYGV
jgi:hypothetical protein